MWFNQTENERELDLEKITGRLYLLQQSFILLDFQPVSYRTCRSENAGSILDVFEFCCESYSPRGCKRC